MKTLESRRKKYSGELNFPLAASAFIAAGFWLQFSNKSILFISPETFYLNAIVLLSAWAAGFLLQKSFPTAENRPFSHFVPVNALLSAAVLCGLLFVNRFSLMQFMNSADEHSCYFFARCLQAGKLWADPHPLAEFFRTPHIGDKAGKWFSVYPPGWPLVWAAAMKAGGQHWINPLLAAAGLYLFTAFGREVYGPKVSLYAAAAAALSPFFFMTGAAYYSHNLCLFLAGIFYFSSYQWLEKGKSHQVLWAAFALGTGLATRYLTMAAIAFPVAVYVAYLIRVRRVKLDRWTAASVVLLFVLLAAQAWFNYKITGKFYDFPNHYLHSHEKLGFIAGYTPLIAFQYLFKRFLYLSDWTPPLITFLFLLSLARKPRNTWDFISKAGALSVSLAYMFYYSWGGNQYGPRYLFEAYPLVVLAASNFIFKQTPDESSNTAQTARILGALILLFSLPASVRHFREFRQISMERRQTYDETERQSEKPALVFMEGFLGDKLVLSPEDSVRNEPFLNAPLVYARDLGAENHKLAPYFPGRHFYHAKFDRIHHKAVIEELHDL